MSQSTTTSDQTASSDAGSLAWLPKIIPMALGLVIVQVLFAASYMGAFGKSETHHAEVIVVGSTRGNAATIANKLNAQEGQPIRAYTSTDEKASIEKVRRDEAVAVYVFRPTLKGKQVDQLYYASAQGAARAQVAKTVAENVGKQGNRQVQSHDIVKAKPDDPRGTAPFYLVLAWMVGAYVLAATMSTLVGPRAGSWRSAMARIGVYAVYAVLSGLAGAWVAMGWYDTLGGSYLQISALGMLLVFTVSVFTYALTALLGPVGVGAAILLFVVLGNPSAGGAFNYDVLPEPWRTVGPYLPNGAGTDGVRSLSYFDGHNLARPIWVLLAWLAFGLWALLMVGNNTYGFGRKRAKRPTVADASSLAVAETDKAGRPEPEYRDVASTASNDPADGSDLARRDEPEPSAVETGDEPETQTLPVREVSETFENPDAEPAVMEEVHHPKHAAREENPDDDTRG